jgi:hypothetical protein
LAAVPHCLIGLEACSGSHHIGRQLGHDVRLLPAQYVKPFLKGHKNGYRDAEAIAEAVQRPTMQFVAIKTPEQMDLLALHRVRSRLVSQRTGVINQIRGFSPGAPHHCAAGPKRVTADAAGGLGVTFGQPLAKGRPSCSGPGRGLASARQRNPWPHLQAR